jgi:hypothetical protein
MSTGSVIRRAGALAKAPRGAFGQLTGLLGLLFVVEW